MSSASRSSVAQCSVSGSQLERVKRICEFVGPKKKKKSHCDSLRVLRKAPTKERP